MLYFSAGHELGSAPRTDGRQEEGQEEDREARARLAQGAPVRCCATTRTSRPSSVAGMAGALALGAGVYGQWVRAPPLPWAQYLVAGGALTLGAALWFSDVSGDPIRVGAVGVAVEHGSRVHPNRLVRSHAHRHRGQATAAGERGRHPLDVARAPSPGRRVDSEGGRAAGPRRHGREGARLGRVARAQGLGRGSRPGREPSDRGARTARPPTTRSLSSETPVSARTAPRSTIGSIRLRSA